MWMCWIPVVEDLNRPLLYRLLLIYLLLSHPWPCQPTSLLQLQVCICASVCSVYQCMSVWSLTLLFSALDEQQQPMEGSVPDAGGENTEQTSATVPQVHTINIIWLYFCPTTGIVQLIFLCTLAAHSSLSLSETSPCFLGGFGYMYSSGKNFGTLVKKMFVHFKSKLNPH